MSETILTDGDLSKILKKKHNQNHFRLVNSVLEPLSTGEGFMGDHYKLQITYEIDGQTCVDYYFVKTVPRKNIVLKDQVEQTGVFTLEIFLYEYLFGELEKFGIDVSFAPKCFYSIPDTTFVMEDLYAQGYILPSARNFFNLEQCRAGLKAIAALHASTLTYEVFKTKELGRDFRIGDEFPDIFVERFMTYFCPKRNYEGEKWFTTSVEVFNELIHLLPATEHFKKDFQMRLKTYPLGKIFVDKTPIRKFVSHSDLWSNNLMFLTENDSIKHCRLLDFQCTRYFYACYDVLTFLLTNMHPDFFEQQSEELMQFYYKLLTENTAKYGVSISDYYPENDYKRSIQIIGFEARLQAFAEHSFFTIPPEFVKSLMPTGAHLLEFKFANRLEITKKYFQVNSEHRALVSRDLYILYSFLTNSFN